MLKLHALQLPNHPTVGPKSAVAGHTGRLLRKGSVRVGIAMKVLLPSVGMTVIPEKTARGLIYGHRD